MYILPVTMDRAHQELQGFFSEGGRKDLLEKLTAEKR